MARSGITFLVLAREERERERERERGRERVRGRERYAWLTDCLKLYTSA